MARSTKLIGPIEGSIPIVETGGTGTASETFRVEVTKAGVSGTAEVTITSRSGGDDVAAQAVTSGTAIDLGTGGGTITFVFDYLYLGDAWTVEVDSGGPVGKANPVTTNRAEYQEARVGTEGALLVRGAPDASKVTIANGNSVSTTAFRHVGATGLMLRMPSGWDTADVGFKQALWPGGTFKDVESGGSRVKMTVTADRDCAAPDEVIRALRAAFWVKLESLNRDDGTAELQSGDASIIVQVSG